MKREKCMAILTNSGRAAIAESIRQREMYLAWGTSPWKALAAQAIIGSNVTLAGAVDGTMVLITYSWKKPRYDLITIDSEGIVRRIKGLAHAWTPSVPKAPNGQLVLAQVFQNWTSGQKPKVANNAIRAAQMIDIEAIKNMVLDLYYLMSQERLKNDANASDFMVLRFC